MRDSANAAAGGKWCRVGLAAHAARRRIARCARASGACSRSRCAASPGDDRAARDAIVFVATWAFGTLGCFAKIAQKVKPSLNGTSGHRSQCSRFFQVPLATSRPSLGARGANGRTCRPSPCASWLSQPVYDTARHRTESASVTAPTRTQQDALQEGLRVSISGSRPVQSSVAEANSVAHTRP